MPIRGKVVLEDALQRPVLAREWSTLPDGGYGWIVVASIFLINAHSWGMTSSYAVFLAYYLSHNTYPNATNLDYAFIGGLSFSMAFATAPIVNFCVKHFGSKLTLCIGVLFQTAAFIGASFATEIWQLFLSQGVALGIGIGFMFVATAGVIPQWFTKGRALANGMASAGSGCGGLIYSLSTNAMIPRLGLSWTFRTLAIIQFVVSCSCTLLLKDRNKQIGSSLASFDIKLMKRPEVLLLLGWAFFSLLGYVTMLFSLPNWAATIGLDAGQGTIVGAMANLGQAISRPIVGHLADKSGCLTVATAATALAGVLCFVFWIFIDNYAQAVTFALMSGAVTGTFFTLVAPVAARVVGLVELPAGLSIVWVSIVLPALFAEPIALELRQSTGRIYLHAQILAACMFSAASFFIWFTRAWKIKEIRRLGEEKGRDASGDTRSSVLCRVLPHEGAPDSTSVRKTRWMAVVERFKRLGRWQRI
ncbi:major facilitator superfamily domain-containing protein [Lipomyces kononenkoae]